MYVCIGMGGGGGCEGRMRGVRSHSLFFLSWPDKKYWILKMSIIVGTEGN